MSTTVTFPALGWSFNINRVAFSIAGFDIYWYGIIIATGLLLGLWYAMKHAREFGIDSDRMLDVILVGTICGIVGARIYYIVFSEPGEFTTFKDMIDLRKGGVGFYGVLIGAFISAFFMCKARKVKFLPLMDNVSIGFLIGQGIGRWGNFFNQEAFGSNTSLPWGMLSTSTTRYLTEQSELLASKGIYVDPSMPVHPTFLYESLWCLLGFILISRHVKKRKFDGEIALMYFAWNGFGRAFIEGLRTDSLYLGSIRISQLLAVIGAVCSILAILVIRSRITKKNDPEYLVPYGHTAQCAADLAAIAAEEKQKKDKKKADAEDTEADLPLKASDAKSNPVTPTVSEKTERAMAEQSAEKTEDAAQTVSAQAAERANTAARKSVYKAPKKDAAEKSAEKKDD